MAGTWVAFVLEWERVRLAPEGAPTGNSALHGRVPRLLSHASQPGKDVRIRRKVEAAVAGAVGVRVKCDVGHSVAPAHEPLAPRQMLLHHREDRLAAFDQ